MLHLREDGLEEREAGAQHPLRGLRQKLREARLERLEEVPPHEVRDGLGLRRLFGGLHVNGQEARQVAVQQVMIGETDAQFIKLDYEGMELDVLQGTDLSTHPILYAEADHASTAVPLLTYLDGLGYRMWWHCPTLYSPDNFKQNATNVWGPGIMSINVLAVHKDQPLPVDVEKHRLLPTATTNIKLAP